MSKSNRPTAPTATENSPAPLRFEAVEPRVLFSATMADVPDEPAVAHHELPLVQEEAFLVAVDAAPGEAMPSGAASTTEPTLQSLNLHAADVEARELTEIVFVVADLPDAEAFAANLDPAYEIHFIAASEDGVAKIASVLEGRAGVDAIHLVAHGESGRLFLGGAVLDAESMAGQYREALAAIGAALSEEADILIYGCDFGEGDSGSTAVSLLAQATGADVAASTDKTGHADLGGNWDLEVAHGEIEAVALADSSWRGLLAPAEISAGSNSLQTYDSGGNLVANGTWLGAGASGVWVGAGTVGSQTVDLIATVVSVGAGSTIQFQNPAAGTDDPAFTIRSAGSNQAASVLIEWRIVLTGTNIPATGDITFTIGDIDGIGGDPFSRETVTPSLNGLTSYGANDPTNIEFAISGGSLQASGTQDQNTNGSLPPIEPEAAALFTWRNVSSWQVSYQLHGNPLTTQARFTHDGDGDFVFTNLETIQLLSIDLDADDSTAPGTSYATIFNEGGPAVAIADSDTLIAQHFALGTEIGSATVVLTNAQAGDELLVAGSSAASGSISGVSYTITDLGGSIAIEFNGVATVAAYESILESITFSNSLAGPSAVDRLVEVTVVNTTYGTTSNTAVATIAVNRAPAANPASVNTAFQTPVALDLLGNDSDPDGDGISLLGTPSLANPSHGTLEFTGGSWVFTPAATFSGTAVVNYTIQDTRGATSSSTHSIVVANAVPVLVDPDPTPGTPFVDPGDATNLIVPAVDNVPLSIGLDDYFDDANNDPLSIVPNLSGAPAWLSWDPATRTLSGTPPIDNQGSVVIPVTVSDGNGGTFVGTVTIAPVNPGPDAQDDDFSAGENGVVVVGNAITNNDTDPDGDPLSAIVQTGVAGNNGGLFSIAANGEVTFDPNGQFDDLAVGETRQTSFVYTLVDADGATDTATVTVTVHGANDAPVAVGTIANRDNVDGQTVAPLDASTFFSDPDTGDVLVYSATGLPPGLAINPVTGVITGTLDTSASVGGPYNVEVTATDPHGANATQSFTWTVTNLPPDAQDDDFSAGENGVVVVGNAITNNDTDPDGDPLSTIVQTGVAGNNGGLFSIAANGEVTFDPNGQFDDLAVGETRQTSFVYTLVDADGATDTATVTVTVHGANGAPVAVGTIANRDNVDGQSVAPLDASTFFSDPDTSDVLAYSATGLPPGLAINPVTGVITGTLDTSASVGSPHTVQVRAEDPTGGFAVQSFTWTVTNLPPDAQDDDFSAGENGVVVVGNAITNNDTDPDGDPLSAIVQTGVAGSDGGLFSIAANGEVTFDPNGQFDDLAVGETRQTSFVYTLVDADGATDTATVTVTVHGANDAPVAVGTIANRDNDDSDPVSLATSGFFDDPDTSDVLTYSATGLPPGLSIDPNTGEISGTIDPSASVNGPYTVEVTASDGNGGTATQTFLWNVANPAPLAVDDHYQVSQKDGIAVVGNAILENDTDPDGDPLSAIVQTGVAGSNGGLFSIAANGEVTFDPNGQFDDLLGGQTRQTSFVYTLVDADGATDTATVTVTVVGVNAPPKAQSGKLSVTVGSTGGKLGLAAPTDPDGNRLTITVKKLPGVGTLRYGNGTPVKVGDKLTNRQLQNLVYDAPLNYRSKMPVVFRYAVSDGQFTTNAKVEIKVRQTAVNHCFIWNYQPAKWGAAKRW